MISLKLRLAGLLYDKQGDDKYTVKHKYALGAATHQSAGIFIDGKGADTYANTGDDEAIGLGYDHGVAFHIDRGDQDDTYTLVNAGDFVLGFARHPALGVLINEGGNDTYTVPASKGERAMGRSWVDADDRKGSASSTVTVGMFLDLGGASDTYNLVRTELKNNAAWRQTTALGAGWLKSLDFGYGLDSQ